ncbi:MAG: OmpA family protein [Bacteroidetes bacterium]|nr:OmpA family protein [Bacteroidota bacterium]MDA0972904.1 OmpA family protein [Bacteroidota bacterium]
MRTLWIILLLSSPIWVWAQETTIINDFGGKRSVEDPMDYRLSSSSSHTFIVNHYTPLSGDGKKQLVDHIISDITYYMEEVVQLTETGVNIRKSDKQMLGDMESIVSFNVKLYDYKVDEEFKGFSDELRQEVRAVTLLDWANSVKRNSEDFLDSKQMVYNYLRSKMNGIRGLAERDLYAFADAHIHEFDFSSPMDPDEEPMDLDTTFRRNAQLPGKDFFITPIEEEDAPMVLLPELSTTLIPKGTDPELVALVKSNNALIQTFGEQMLLMQRELLDIKKEGLNYQAEFRSIREELGDLQVAIEELKDANSSSLSGNQTRPVQSGVAQVVRFDKNSEEISLEDQLRLNDIYYRLMTYPDQKVMITGFADRSGNTELNANISRRRALAVKSYLRSKGVESQRLIINFLGDTYSESENAMDRKVEIAWLNP